MSAASHEASYSRNPLRIAPRLRFLPIQEVQIGLLAPFQLPVALKLGPGVFKQSLMGDFEKRGSVALRGLKR